MANVPKRKRLSRKRRRFVEEYVVDWNGTQAAIRAGYSAKTAAAQANRLLRKVEILEELDRRVKRIADGAEVRAARILRELARVAFADLRDIVEWGPDGVTLRPSDDLTPDQAAAVSEVSQGADGHKRIKSADKLRALELLGKRLGLFSDRLIHAGDADAPMALQIVEHVVTQRDGAGEGGSD